MPFPAYIAASLVIAIATTAGTLLLSRARLQGLAIALALVGATGLLLLHGLGYFHLVWDDSFITFRYADNLASGLGPNWNSEGRVEGYTTFLWMVLLAGPAKIGLDLVVTSRVLGVIAVVATFFIVYRIWKLWSDEEHGSGIESPVLFSSVILGLALTDGVAFWGLSGMETPLFTALITGGAYLYFLERRGSKIPWSAVAFAAAAMTRPEGLIVAAVTGAFMMAEVVRGSDKEGALRRYLSWAALFLILYGTYFLWRYTYYDYLLPNTFYAKVGLTRAALDRGLDYVWVNGLRYQLLAVFAGTAALLTRPRLRHDVAYIIILSAAMLGGIIVEGGDAFRHGRFIVPLLPLLYLGGLAGFAVVLRQLNLNPARAAATVSVLLILGGLSLIPASRDATVRRERVAMQERQLLGTWLSENTPPDFIIGAYAVGAVGYYGERDILDLVGINDVTIAHAEVSDLGSGLAGHEKFNLDYVLEEVRPELIIFSDAGPRLVTEQELKELFSTASREDPRRELLNDPRLWEDYQVRSLFIENKWFNFLQRADTIDELQAPGLQ